MPVSFDGPFTTPFFTSTQSTSSQVPGRFMVSLAGRPYMLDLEKFTRRSSPVIRQQADASTEPGEQSLSPNDLWRRSQSTWVGGAGQEFLDLPDSTRTRFNTSKGINPWVKGKLSLLPDTMNIDTHAGTTPLMAVVAGSRLYFANNQTLKFMEGQSFAIVSGTAAFPITSLATDGYTVYIGYGSSAPIGATNTSITTAATWDSGAGATTFTADTLAYVKNRLMATVGTALYNLKTSAARTTLTPAFLPASWKWTGFAETPGFILAAGFTGESSQIFRITIQPEGTDLAQPIAASTLPKSELVQSLGYYLGFVLIGTSVGVRLGNINSSGDLVFGPAVKTPQPVYCFERQGDFVWFGWSNFDSTSTGIGRMDLKNFTLGNRPAYASDLMAAGQGRVVSIATFQDRLFFAVQGLGLYVESYDTLNPGLASFRVPSGYITTGQMSYGLTDPKVFYYLSLRHEALLAGQRVQAALAVDKTPTGTVIESGSVGTTGFSSQQAALGASYGVTGELTFTLFRGTDTRTTPTVVLYTVRSWPIPRRSEEIVLPILLQESVLTNNDSPTPVKVQTEFTTLKALEKEGLPMTLQIGRESMTVFIDSITFSDAMLRARKDGFQGLLTVLVRRFE